MNLIPVGIVISKGESLIYYNSFMTSLAAKNNLKEDFQSNEELEYKERNIVKFFQETKNNENSTTLNTLFFSEEETRIKQGKYIYSAGENKIPLSVGVTTFQDKKEKSPHKVCVIHDQTLYEELETSRMESQYQKSLFAMVNHELRNPLHGLLGIFEIIMGYNVNDELKHQCRIGISTGNLMLLLVNDILDISQLEACNFKLTEKSFSISEAISECIEIMKYRYEQKGVALLSKVKGDISIINDKNRFKQIVINLLSNAIKFTSNGYVKVTCSYNPDNQCLMTKVKDTGEGIKPEEKNKMFTMYCKLEQQKSANPTGN